ncbi:hypothetical protein RIF23_00860 [Lipingzhangella sp. LS1_29]|uniref:Uncharacterized protein n=1 Tax=Lipingzhangella rawalii TaxID=2055835 RepID=A0ABU2H0L2_9ACTN|nr:hypothetical protein [Lipingzhangella rawalii]MDS1268837.1 hypothetical protein [Lipingzhangella rawalii]
MNHTGSAWVWHVAAVGCVAVLTLAGAAGCDDLTGTDGGDVETEENSDEGTNGGIY